ncbi:hypothetical protein NPIL_395131 [Nephila pilipes]|uniref:Uncharacterized protein n=1 Tax=Nephila pilipes TaxID=299642 RepID=A0A8X6R3X5_NEPPI|nr:hypothetical protein NPIL_395131 [Nephila pilipes]
MPSSMSAEMTNFRTLSDANIAKLTEDIASEEENVSEYENHTNDGIESDSSGNDFDIDIQRMHNIQSNNYEIQRKLDTISHSG